MIEERLHELTELPVPVPAGLARRAWVVGRQQRRRQIRIAVCSVALLAGVTVGVVVADPALATPPNTVAAQAASGAHCSAGLIGCPTA